MDKQTRYTIRVQPFRGWTFHVNWSVRRFGRPNSGNLAKWVARYNETRKHAGMSRFGLVLYADIMDNVDIKVVARFEV